MGKPVCLIGGGRSFLDGINLGFWEKIKDKAEVWSLNFAFIFMPYLPSRQLWVDVTFFRNNMNQLEELSKKGVLMNAKSHMQYSNIKTIKQYNVFKNIKEIHKFPDHIFDGQMGLVGLFALSVAVKEEYSPIYLLGYDFGTGNVSNTNTHWYQEQKEEKHINSYGIGNTKIYMQPNNVPSPMITDFEYYLKFTNKIYNVSSKNENNQFKTNISYFKIINFEDFFKMIEDKNEPN